jgi:hypothetical protein
MINTNVERARAPRVPPKPERTRGARAEKPAVRRAKRLLVSAAVLWTLLGWLSLALAERPDPAPIPQEPLSTNLSHSSASDQAPLTMGNRSEVK